MTEKEEEATFAESSPIVATVKDPVCSMEVNPNNVERVDYQGKKYYFCSSICKIKFQHSPQNYSSADHAA